MAGSPRALVRAFRLLREPVPDEKRRLMRTRWDALSPELRTSGQGLGQQATGCGATIGVHPRCDFACAGCYLGADANHVPPAPLQETFRQLDRLRAWLGPKGNTQITDGEVTLLPIEDLIAILRYSRAIGLIPMVMTHGDSFRRHGGMLERLMCEGGLTEVSVHVDTTQRGRLGYQHARREAELEPLRDEFAAMIRGVRARTRRPLRAAMTLTVTRDNLADIPQVVAWCLKNRDVFGMLSLQPVAQVGRTRQDLPGITVEELWGHIDEALAEHGLSRRRPRVLTFGHADCTRMELLAVYQRAGTPARLLPILREDQDTDLRMLREFFTRGLGGVNFRDDAPLDRVARAIGVAGIAPGWMAGPLRRWVLERLADAGTSAARLGWDIARRRVTLGAFTVVSHHFMSAAELASARGQERLSACLFRVPIGDEMVSMCRVNAGGLREAAYGARRWPLNPEPVVEEIARGHG